MGQKPNIEITLRQLPPAHAEPDPARRWSPRRPGELDGPDAVPWGGAFGRPGPDSGFAVTLARGRDLLLAEGERLADAVAAVAAVASARASFFGRAPVKGDVDVACVILCYDQAGVPAAVSQRVAAARSRWVADLARKPHNAAALLREIELDVLTADIDVVRAEVADGAVL